MYSRLDLSIMASTALIARDNHDARFVRLVYRLSQRTGLSTLECVLRIEAMAEGRDHG